MSLDFLKRLAGMTRETKLGLVVGCSFLCLLGVVIGLKMNEREDTPPESDARESQAWSMIWDSSAKTDPVVPVVTVPPKATEIRPETKPSPVTPVLKQPEARPAVRPPVSAALLDGMEALFDSALGGSKYAPPAEPQPRPFSSGVQTVALQTAPGRELPVPPPPTATESGTSLPPTLSTKSTNGWGTVWANTKKNDLLDIPPVGGSEATPPNSVLPPVATTPPAQVKPVPESKVSNVWSTLWAKTKNNDSPTPLSPLPPAVVRVEPTPPPQLPGPPPTPTTPSLPDAPPLVPKTTNVWGTVWAMTKKSDLSTPSSSFPPAGGIGSIPPPLPGFPQETSPSSPGPGTPAHPVSRVQEQTASPGIPGLPPAQSGSDPKPEKNPPSVVDLPPTKPIEGKVSMDLPKPSDQPGLPPVGGTTEESKTRSGLPDIGVAAGTTPKPPPLEMTIPPTVPEKPVKEAAPKLSALPPPPSGTERGGNSPPPIGISLEGPSTATPVSIGSVPGRTVPPVAVSPEPQRTPRGPQPQVIEYLESMHKIQPGDTFEKISLEQYGSKDYAAALLLYNRGHPIVGESFANDTATLAPGQRIFLPSNKELLESRYPAAIKNIATQTQSNAPPVETVPPKTYTVAAGGESFARIALRLFSNVDRWPEIRNLNRDLDPEKPIPAGTVLKIPGDARLP